MEFYCPLCNYGTYRAHDWTRHVLTAKHASTCEAPSNNGSLFTCGVCKYATERPYNLKKHLSTRKHHRAYLAALLHSSKPTELWEEDLISSRSGKLRIERLLSKNCALFLERDGLTSVPWSAALYLQACLESVPVEEVPVIAVEERFWLVHQKKGWRRMTGLALLALTKAQVSAALCGLIEAPNGRISSYDIRMVRLWNATNDARAGLRAMGWLYKQLCQKGQSPVVRV